MGRGIFGGIRWRRKQERVTEGMEWLTGPMAKLYISNGRAEEGPNRSCWVILIQKWPLKPGLGLSSRPKPGPKWGPTIIDWTSKPISQPQLNVVLLRVALYMVSVHSSKTLTKTHEQNAWYWDHNVKVHFFLSLIGKRSYLKCMKRQSGSK